MEEPKSNIIRNTIAKRPSIIGLTRVMSLVMLVGLVGFAVPITRAVFVYLTPVIVIMGTLVLLWFHTGDTGLRFWIWTAFVLLGGFFVEVIGVNTGLIFGDYTYGNVLGPKVWGTPLLLGINWYLVVYAAHGAMEELNAPWWIKIPAAGILITVFDIVLEPVAVGFGMWEWDDVQVPMQNYFAWFILGMVFVSVYHILKIKSYNASSGPVYLTMFLFFMLLNLILLF